MGWSPTLAHMTTGPADDALAVCVLGPGGVGGLVAATLARLGDQVTCLCGHDSAEVLLDSGLTLDSGFFGSFAVAVTAQSLLTRPVDVCFVAVKAPALESALERVPAQVLEAALVIPLLNGIEHVRFLRERYPRAEVVAASMRVESTRVAPGRIRQVSPFARLDLAAGPADAPSAARLVRVATHLTRCGFDVRMPTSEVDVLWGKFAFLTPLALLTTRNLSPVGVVRTRYRADLIAVLDEACMVGRAEGADLDAAAALAFCDFLPATMRSSMQRDAAAGRPTEIDALGGGLLRAAARHGIDVPVSTRLVRDLTTR